MEGDFLFKKGLYFFIWALFEKKVLYLNLILTHSLLEISPKNVF